MLEVTGFRGLTFDSRKVGSHDHVVTPPYDVISPDDRVRLAALSPYNMVHLLLPQEENGQSRYSVAAARLDAWVNEGILLEDAEASFYLLRQTFIGPKGERNVRRGFFGAMRLPEPGERYILEHERTFQKPMEDRQRLTEATRANLGAVFTLYSDPEDVLAPFLSQMDARAPEAGARTMDGVFQEFWRVPHDDAVTGFFRGKTLYIADGHHRFATACAYRDAMRAAQGASGPQPYDYALMAFVAFEDPGLCIYPPHRLVPTPPGFEPTAFLAGLRGCFEVIQVDGRLAECVEAPDPAGRPCVLGVAIHGCGDYLLALDEAKRTRLIGDEQHPALRALDVAVLHRGILERVLGVSGDTQFAYEKNAENALAAVHRGEVGLAFILRGTRADQVRACAEANEPMPPKSTYFFPKIPSGVVIKRLF